MNLWHHLRTSFKPVPLSVGPSNWYIWVALAHGLEASSPLSPLKVLIIRYLFPFFVTKTVTLLYTLNVWSRGKQLVLFSRESWCFPRRIVYYMASSVSGQGEPNRTLWLATRVGKMMPSFPFGTTRCIAQEKFPRKPYNKSFIDQACSVKMAGYWPRSFLRVSVHKHAKEELGQ